MLVLRKSSDTPVYYVGRVPCRNVKIMGMVVGVSQFERKNIIAGTPHPHFPKPYSAEYHLVDDGSAVIECAQMRTPAKPPSQSWKPGTQATVTGKEVQLPLPPLGSLVSIVGRVHAWHDSKQLYVNEMG